MHALWAMRRVRGVGLGSGEWRYVSASFVFPVAGSPQVLVPPHVPGSMCACIFFASNSGVEEWCPGTTGRLSLGLFALLAELSAAELCACVPFVPHAWLAALHNHICIVQFTVQSSVPAVCSSLCTFHHLAGQCPFPHGTLRELAFLKKTPCVGLSVSVWWRPCLSLTDHGVCAKTP
jgi:hypothetical protein